MFIITYIYSRLINTYIKNEFHLVRLIYLNYYISKY